MPEQEELKDLTEQSEVENARVGYQVATSLWVYEGESLWSKFNALLVANSIVLGSIGLAMGASSRVVVFSVGMPIVGIILCVFWFLLTKRSFDNYIYWIFSAREIEERFLINSVKTISRGGDFTDGKEISLQIGSKPRKFQMSRLGRLLRVRWISYFIIGLFLVMYTLILIVS